MSSDAVNAAPAAASAHSTLIVHHLNNSRSQRILWLLEELEVPYEIKLYQRTAELLAPKELLDIHPLGKSPVITDGDVTLAESGAIVEYIISKYGGGKASPPDAGKIDNLYFSHYAEGTLMPLAVNKLVFSIVPGRSPFLIRPIVRTVFDQLTNRLVNPQLKRNLDLVEAHLAKSGDFFAGGNEPTSADYMMLFPLEALTARSKEHIGPRVQEWVNRIHERPAYKRGIEKGGQYDYA